LLYEPVQFLLVVTDNTHPAQPSAKKAFAFPKCSAFGVNCHYSEIEPFGSASLRKFLNMIKKSRTYTLVSCPGPKYHQTYVSITMLWKTKK